MDDTTPRWPHVDVTSKADLMAERRRLINALGAVESILREDHGYTIDSINPQTVRPEDR